MNMKSPSRVVNHPNSVESTPRCSGGGSFISVVESDLVMPDLVTDGTACGGVATPRIQEYDGPLENDRDQSAGHLDHVSKTVQLVDTFNGVFQERINYFEKNCEYVEGMRVS